MDFLFRIFAWLLLLTSVKAFAVLDAEYLPNDTQYKVGVTTPTQALGASVGEWHARHDQIANYMQLLAAQSDRVSLVETGRTHENRPLHLLAFSSAKNQQNLAAIQARHIQKHA